MIAAAGVVALMRPQPSADYLGMALGLLAAGRWASYILLNRTVGRRIPGARGSAAAAGVLSSAVPYLADPLTLRHGPARAFGLFMSANPVLASLVGRLALDQGLGPAEWASIGAIVAADSPSILTSRG